MFLGSCGGEYLISNTQSLTIQSPNYPASYPDSVECVWNLVVQQDRVVELTFTEISLEANHDSVSVYNGYCVEARNFLNSYTGVISGQPQHNSSGDALTVRLLTDCSITGRGFQAIARSLPRGATTDPTAAPSTPTATIRSTTCPTIPPTQPAGSSCGNNNNKYSFNIVFPSCSYLCQLQPNKFIGQFQSQSSSNHGRCAG